MSNKSIIASLLVTGGVILHLVVVWSGLNIDPENSEHIGRAIGMTMPGIFIAVIAGLIVGLVVHLFSKERTKSKFFLVFSIFFFATILVIAYGMSENRKIEESRNEEVTQELSSLYISDSQGFKVAFPTKPQIAQNDYSPYGIEGNATVYISTKDFSGQEVIYYVIINDMKALSFVDDAGRQNYYNQFPIIGLAEAGAQVTKISSNVKKVYNGNEGVEYTYQLEADGETLFKKGIDFIIDGKGYQVSIIYPHNLDNRIEDVYSDFISSFVFL